MSCQTRTVVAVSRNGAFKSQNHEETVEGKNKKDVFLLNKLGINSPPHLLFMSIRRPSMLRALFKILWKAAPSYHAARETQREIRRKLAAGSKSAS